VLAAKHAWERFEVQCGAGDLLWVGVVCLLLEHWTRGRHSLTFAMLLHKRNMLLLH
jgi:hypothetical protein